ncbi:MAG: glycoside hydrolase family 3 protein [Burkholderiales bacterium]|nr:glycoside hydrolase family 3 protein [Burkholderiales bacterium]
MVTKPALKQQLLELIMLDIRYFNEGSSEQLVPVTKLPAQLLSLLKNYPVGGIVLFRENLVDIPQILNLTNALQYNTTWGRLIGIDQEGGLVTRISTATTMPGNMALGAINNLNITTKVAAIIGSELDALGINLNFAPCVDVNSNPNNPVIGVRSFGQNPLMVANHGAAYIEGLKQQQIISCVKHFPGHGNTVHDSHLGETIVNSSAANLEQCDFIPFKLAIDRGVDMVMLAHVVVPTLDNEYIYSSKLNIAVKTPATFSYSIVTQLLREQLGFTGVITSDALDMQAIAGQFNPVEATILALKAGVDLIVMPLKIRNEREIHEFITYFNQVYTICANSTELCNKVEQSYNRVLELKHKYQVGLRNLLLENQLKKAMHLVGCDKHREFEQQIAKKAITLYKNVTQTLPWRITLSDKVLIISTNELIAKTSKIIMEEKLKGISVTIRVLNDTHNNIDDMKLQDVDKVLLLTYNLIKPINCLNQIVEQLNDLAKPYVMLSCGNPYDIRYVDKVTTNVLIFGTSGFDRTNNLVGQFTLNLTQALVLVFKATNENEFNHYLPVDLNVNNAIN